MNISLFPFLRLLVRLWTSWSGCSRNGFSEIKYFHPEGESLKNGVYVYKGFFLGECGKNARSFCLHPYFIQNLDNKGRCKGGLILFPESMNFSNNEMIQRVNFFLSKTKNNRSANPDLKFEVSNHFFGQYISPHGFKYGSQSITIDICEIGHRKLLKLADLLFNDLKTGSIVVKDFNRNKFYYKEL